MDCIEELRMALGEAVLAEPGAGSRYVSDKSETGREPPRAVIRPRSVEEVATALRI
jgi:FAD/FMN-containing dehydrogenase